MIASTISLRWEVKPSVKRKGADLEVFRRAEFAILVMEDWNKFCIGKQPKISVTIQFQIEVGDF